MERYLTVFVYRNDLGDATNNGFISKVHNNSFVVPHPEGNISKEDVGDRVILDVRERMGRFHAVPRTLVESGKWTMMGGNYIGTSDSRFNTYTDYLLPVHDRVE